MSDAQSAEELLKSALSSAFTPISIAPAPPSPKSESDSAPTAAQAPTEASAPLVSQEEKDKYEEERAVVEQSWREQSAVQRREAEERRARIAAERAASGETWEKLESGKPLTGPPNSLSGYPGSPSPADVRDVVSGEPSGSRHVEASPHTSPHTTATLEHSQRWEEIEDVPSMESSFPSLSFPEQSDSAPSDHASKSGSKAAKKDRSKEKSSLDKAATAADALPSATLSVFDSRLSPRARIIALVSSLSINLLLPFVNGVMLGFGEIFARNMASRFFGWNAPGGAVTAVGVEAARSRRR